MRSAFSIEIPILLVELGSGLFWRWIRNRMQRQPVHAFARSRIRTSVQLVFPPFGPQAIYNLVGPEVAHIVA